jgi:photosystem II stability/assembly factor-like uncharacterized protein
MIPISRPMRSRPVASDSPSTARRRLGLAAIWGALSLALNGLSAAGDTSLDPLDRPAVRMKEPAAESLLSIAAAGRRLVAVGTSGLVVLSDDEGRTWIQVPSPVSVTLTAVAFANASVGWAVGHSGVILVTRDAGRTWSRQLDGRSMLASLLDQRRPRTAVADSDGGALDPVDQLIEDGPDKPLLAVLPIDADHVVAVGAYGMLLVTDDGGANWRVRLDLTTAAKGKHLYAVRSVGHQLFFAGEAGTLCRSDGASAPLVALASPYSGSFFGLVRTPPGELLAFGLRGHAVISSDRGQVWRALDVGASGSINVGLILSDGRVLLATETGDIRLSKDEGRTFASAATPVRSPIYDLIQSGTGIIGVGSGGVVRFSVPTASP